MRKDLAIKKRIENFEGKTEAKISLGQNICTFEDSIKMELKAMRSYFHLNYV